MFRHSAGLNHVFPFHFILGKKLTGANVREPISPVERAVMAITCGNASFVPQQNWNSRIGIFLVGTKYGRHTLPIEDPSPAIPDRKAFSQVKRNFVKATGLAQGP